MMPVWPATLGEPADQQQRSYTRVRPEQWPSLASKLRQEQADVWETAEICRHLPLRASANHGRVGPKDLKEEKLDGSEEGLEERG